MHTVFLLGDSISADYADAATRALTGVAAVELRPENGQDSRNLMAKAGEWLGERHFDVIHWNCGLHDIKRARDVGHATQVPIEEYEENLHWLVDLLKPHAGALVWARTTPLVEALHQARKVSFDRYLRDVDAYNAVADRVMAAHGMAVNDLHGAAMTAGLSRVLLDDGLHLSEEGQRTLGGQVAAAVRRALAAHGKATPEG